MLTISPINLILKSSPKKQKITSSPIVMHTNPAQDVFIKSSQISFKSESLKKPKWMDETQFREVKELLSKERQMPRLYSIIKSFTQKEKEEITNALTKKNIEYLKPIIEMNQFKLNADNIVNMLKYIDETDESKEDIDYKINFMSNIEENLKDLLGRNLYTQKQKYGAMVQESFFDDINNTTFLILLKTDILTSKDESSNFKTTAEKISNRISSRKDWGKEDKDKQADIRKKQIFTASNLGEIMLASTMMSPYVFNNFVYNKMVGGAFGEYSKKLDILEQSDIDFLRHVSKYAKCSDDDKEGKLGYTNVVRIFDMTAGKRLLKNNNIIKSSDKNPKISLHKEDGNYNFFIDNIEIGRDLLGPVLLSNGISQETVDLYLEKYDNYLRNLNSKENSKINSPLFWDSDYIYLLINEGNNDDLKQIVKDMTEIVAYTPDITNLDMQEVFFDYISNKNEQYAKAFKYNKKAFERHGINYEKWLKPNIEPETYIINKTKEDSNSEKKGKNLKSSIEVMVEDKTDEEKKTKQKIYTAKLWRRIPQESIMDGNYTTCCTGIGKTQGDSFPKYMTNTFANIVEVRNERGEVKAMSRIYFVLVNNKPSLLIDNVEVNNATKTRHLKNSKKDIINFRNMIFRYINKFAEHINDNEEPLDIYFTTMHPKVEGILEGLKKSITAKEVGIIGMPDNCYINTRGGNMNFFNDSDTFETKEIADISNLNLEEIKT